jgi:hypothetical protein
MNSRTLIFSLVATALALLFGLAMHFLAVFLRDNGPSFDSISFRGNGALIILPMALLGLIIGKTLCVRRRAWLGVVLLPLAV